MKKIIVLLFLLAFVGGTFAGTTVKIISKESAKNMVTFCKAGGPNSEKVMTIMKELVGVKEVKYLKFTFTDHTITVVGVNEGQMELKLPRLMEVTSTTIDPGPCPHLCD